MPHPLGCVPLPSLSHAWIKHAVPSPIPYDCSPWRPGSQVMARCTFGRPALGSDSTISRSGHQGPPLPDTDLAQAAGSNFLSNVALEPGSTGYVEILVRTTGRGRGR